MIPEQAEWERQLALLVEQHRSFPSIYTWMIYNEGWGQLPSAPELYLTPMVRSLDPTRLIDSVSGWNDHGAGDFSDNHHVRVYLPSIGEETSMLIALAVLESAMWIASEFDSFQSLRP